MCELRSQLPVQEGNLILSFCTCSRIPSLSQAGIVPWLMERESWGKLWWVIINQPAMKTSRYSKHKGSAGRQPRNPLLLVFFGNTTVLHPQGATFDCRNSLLKAHALIDCITAADTGPFKSLQNYGSDRNRFPKLVIVSQHCVSARPRMGCSQTPGSADICDH